MEVMFLTKVPLFEAYEVCSICGCMYDPYTYECPNCGKLSIDDLIYK